VQRRERTRHLIELGGLVQKAGLVELADDDRATIYGALLSWSAALAATMPATRSRSGSGAANARSTRKRRRKAMAVLMQSAAKFARWISSAAHPLMWRNGAKPMLIAPTSRSRTWR
jgi:hypothetical protein